MMRRNSVLLLLLGCGAATMMASPTYKAAVPAVEADAFYAINLPYQVLGVARGDLADVRIVDTDGREVAWMLQEEERVVHTSEFAPLPIEVVTLPRRTEVLISHVRQPLSSFVLRIKNSDVSKETTLLGSNNGVKWFAVKDRFLLNRVERSTQTELFLNVDFPMSDYQYYKLALNDSLSAPLNIIEVGLLKREALYPQRLMEVPLVMSDIAVQGKASGIQLVLPFRFQIERLDFYLGAPRFFSREMELLKPQTCFFATTLSDQKGYPQPVDLCVVADTLQFSIYKGDDQALTIDSVKAYVRRVQLVAGLRKGVSYSLTFGDARATFPEYDLSFGKQLADSLVQLTVGAVQQLPAEAPSAGPSWWRSFVNSYGVWVAIVLIILQILYMVRRMIKRENESGR